MVDAPIAGAPMALDDLRVLDLTVARAGPTAVRQFADWGADVIRIEPPPRAGGEHIIGQRHSPDALNLHRNKRSITLNLKSDAGRAVFFDLARTADVVIENMRPPVKARLGVDYEAVAAVNPRIVYGSISGFGQDGPYAERGGVDQIAQGLGGLMSITGPPGGEPTRVGVPISDLAAGMYLAMGILAALHERERSGRGQWVTTSLLESMVAMLDFQAARWTVAGEVPGSAGNHHPTAIPMGTFATADGHVNIAGPSGRLWRNFCAAIGRPDLVDDDRYADADGRSRRRDELNAVIGEAMAAKTSAEWIEILNDAGVPCGPVNRIDQTMADPQVRHLGMAVPVVHDEVGEIDIVRNAVSMSRTPHRMRSAAPVLGAHTDEVLAELGIGRDRLDRLRDEGAV